MVQFSVQFKTLRDSSWVPKFRTQPGLWTQGFSDIFYKMFGDDPSKGALKTISEGIQTTEINALHQKSVADLRAYLSQMQRSLTPDQISFLENCISEYESQGAAAYNITGPDIDAQKKLSDQQNAATKAAAARAEANRKAQAELDASTVKSAQGWGTSTGTLWDSFQGAANKFWYGGDGVKNNPGGGIAGSITNFLFELPRNLVSTFRGVANNRGANPDLDMAVDIGGNIAFAGAGAFIGSFLKSIPGIGSLPLVDTWGPLLGGLLGLRFSPALMDTAIGGAGNSGKTWRDAPIQGVNPLVASTPPPAAAAGTPPPTLQPA